MDSTFLSALLALLAAVSWGSGDFTSGLAARRIGPFSTVLLVYSVGLLALVAVAFGRGESLPPAPDLIWGMLSGLLGMTGLGFLMRGFATGRMGIVAPVSAVLTAAIPVIFAAITEGLPGGLQVAGFVLALAGIWLLSRPEKLGGRPEGLGMALLAGLGFGGFFIALGQISSESVFWPLVAGRLAACAVMVVYALSSRRPLVPANASLGLLVLAGLVDVAGNLFFLLATQNGRLDVVAVLASLYPAVTAILARLLAGERMVLRQVLGMAAALVAIVMITV